MRSALRPELIFTGTDLSTKPEANNELLRHYTEKIKAMYLLTRVPPQKLITSVMYIVADIQ